MTVILVLVYIGLTRLVMWIFDGTIFSWTTRIIFIVAVNAAASYIMFDYIDDQFEVFREIQRKYYKRYEDFNVEAVNSGFYIIPLPSSSARTKSITPTRFRT